MAGCLDGFQLPRFEWFELSEKRNAVSSIIAGALFAIGWWIIIDVSAVYSFNFAFHICGIFGTISLFMINAVSISQIRGESYTTGFLGQNGLRVWLFIGFVLGFSSIIAATWFLISNFYLNQEKDQPKYPGLGLFAQNILIFASSIIFKFGRTEELWQ